MRLELDDTRNKRRMMTQKSQKSRNGFRYFSDFFVHHSSFFFSHPSAHHIWFWIDNGIRGLSSNARAPIGRKNLCVLLQTDLENLEHSISASCDLTLQVIITLIFSQWNSSIDTLSSSRNMAKSATWFVFPAQTWARPIIFHSTPSIRVWFQIHTECDITADGNHVYSSQPLLGRRDDLALEILARQLQEKISRSSTKPSILAMALRGNDEETLRTILTVMEHDEIKLW